ncbi:beta strand repeat-containing protein [Patiriisocius hiemis]|uniref:Peptidase S74 domain-containing protein n=1 Tax=Patiriisocius hiemis TaxID=3075604 RepID=A0ABU2YAX0_9FLAO|nr:hypothetical protein [Constantimarinum sp. W242]MDT0555334.1 hypothetical protein [Constantimarinum sp. W242]
MISLKKHTVKRPQIYLYAICAFFTFFALQSSYSQIGINTTTPEPSSMLDINSSNKGLLVPRVALTNVNNSLLDGINTAANGLLIYNTNASVTGGAGIGFYVFNGTLWEKLSTSADSGGDADFFEEGTTNAPNDITDDIYTEGNVAIGKNMAFYPLDIEATDAIRGQNIMLNGTANGAQYGQFISNTNSGNGNHYGTYNTVSGTGTGTHFGSYQQIIGSGNGTKHGNYNRVAGSGNGFRNGTYNEVTSTATSAARGTYNFLNGTGSGARYGTHNVLQSNSSGRIYGTYNDIIGNGTERKFGSYNTINAAAGGTHYGIYSDVSKAGSFSGFFKGAVAIGTTPFQSGTPDYYIMPASRGTNGQIMQTDASGNVNWVDTSSIAGEDHDFYEVGTTDAPDDINDNIFTQGNVGVGTTNPLAKITISENSSNINALRINNITTSESGGYSSIYNSLSRTIDNASTSGSYGIENRVTINGASTVLGIFPRVFGVRNQVAGTNAYFLGGTDNYVTVNNNGTASGIYNVLQGTNTLGNLSYGTYNNVNISGTGTTIGTRNQIYQTQSTGEKYGVFNVIGNNTITNTAPIYGVRNNIGRGAGIQYGIYNFFNNTGTGEKYGTYTLFPSFAGNQVSGTLYGSSIVFGGTVQSSLNKYGYHVNIPSTNAGIHYGVYSDVTKSDSYAGYFLGRTAIGTTTANTYILPQSRGTNGQIMQTDASGNVNWVDTSSIAGEDHDFYEVGTTDAPDNINDDIYTQGNVAIGRVTALYPLDISAIGLRAVNVLMDGTDDISKSGTVNTITNDGNGQHQGVYNIISGDGSGDHYGVYNTLGSNGTGSFFGTYSRFNSTSANEEEGIRNEFIGDSPTTQRGVNNRFTNDGSGNRVGIFNTFFGSGNGLQTGVSNVFNNTGNGVKVGFDAVIAGGNGDRYGFRTNINTGGGGTHYGISSVVLKPGSFSGYFLGNVSIGTTTTNNYILPQSRGTNGQIMQTDGSGNVGWVDLPASTSFWSRSGNQLDVATAGDNINFTSDQTSITFPATTGTPSSMMYLFESGTSNTDRMVFSQSSLFENWGLMYRDSNDSFRFLRNGADRVVINIGAGNPLVVNGTAQATSFQSDTTTYPDYVFEKYYNNTSEINDEYTFKTLDEVEKFIKENGHLPGVTSYNEVKEQGMTINLSETSVKNLEKIEELFLYTIELKKENDILKQKHEALEERLKKIESLLFEK